MQEKFYRQIIVSKAFNVEPFFFVGKKHSTCCGRESDERKRGRENDDDEKKWTLFFVLVYFKRLFIKLNKEDGEEEKVCLVKYFQL